jgi:hypothetical protein
MASRLGDENQTRNIADKFLCMLFHMRGGNMLRSRDIDDIWKRLELHGFDGDQVGATDAAVQNLIADRGERPLFEQVPLRNVKLTRDGLLYCREYCTQVLRLMNLGMPQ